MTLESLLVCLSMFRVLIPIARDMQAQRQHCIKLICTDVDGTLLNSDQQLTDGVVDAVQQAYNLGIPVRPRLIVTHVGLPHRWLIFIATGTCTFAACTVR